MIADVGGIGLAIVLGWGVLAVLFARSRASGDAEPVAPDGGSSDASGSGSSNPTEAESAGGGHLPAGIVRVFTTINHRDIGLLYLAFAVGVAVWGATDAVMIRTALLSPEATIWNEQTYNELFTAHGFTMLFLFATPAFTGLANYLIPLLIGADDMAMPRINAIAFWLLPPALLLVRAGLVTEVLGKLLGAGGIVVDLLFALEPTATGWTLYTPMAAEMANPQINLTLLGLHLAGIASVLAAINFIVTIVAERDEGVTWANLDIFSWAMLTQSGLVLFAFPLLGSALVMLLLDRTVGTTFFAMEGGGALLWQHLFWFFGHPEVYILVLPAFGLISLILPKFCARRLFGFRFVVYSTLAIGVLSFGVWAHHMFTTGMDPRLRAAFMAVSIAIAVPSAVKTFNWITTMWNGQIRLAAPMLFCIGGIGTFVVGGVTGVFLASPPIDLLVHGTYYVVGHFHLIFAGVMAFSMFAASYYWFPMLVGRWYDRRLANVHFALSLIGVLVTFTPLLLLGYLGLPRRSATYPEQFALLQTVATAGAFVIGTSVVVWLFNVVQSIRVGERVTSADPWDLGTTGQLSREWRWFAAEQHDEDSE